MDWDSDPELKRMCEEFIDSMGDRLSSLRERADKGSTFHIAHQLAGSAETYGLPTLGKIGAAVEDWILSPAFDEKYLARFAALLELALGETIRDRRDPARLDSDPRLKELISAVADPGAGPRSGSS